MNRKTGLLLDSHILIWYLQKSNKLSAELLDLIEESENLYASLVSIWEIGIKESIGKLYLDQGLEGFTEELTDLGFRLLPIQKDHLFRQVALPLFHRDPFDRLLIAQAIQEGIILVSQDRVFEEYSSAGLIMTWQ